MAREQVTGKFGEEEIVLNNAASEATLEKLLKEVERKGTGNDSDEIKRLKQELQRLKGESDKTGESIGALGDAASGAVSSIGRGFGHTADAAVGLTKEFVTGSMRISDFSSHITGFINQIPLIGGIIGGPLQLLAEFVDKNVDTFRELSTVGIDFGDSVFAAQEAATRSGLSLGTFSQTVGQSSESLALLAGDASSGARRFREVSSRVQESAMRFANLGLTLEETAAFTGDYLEQQTRLGQAQGMNANRLGRQTTDYIDQLDRLARVTGQQREQISEQLKQQALDKRLQGLLATMDDTARETLQGVLSTVETASPDVAEAFKNMVATGGVPVTDFGRDLLRTNERLGTLARGLRNGSVTYEEAMAEFRRSGRIAKNQGDGMLQFTGTLAALGSEVGSAGLALLGFENIAENVQKVEQERIDAMQSGAKGFATFEAALTQARNEILGTLIRSEVFEDLQSMFADFIEYLSGDGLDIFKTQIEKFSIWFGGWVTAINDGTGTLTGMLVEVGDKMVDLLVPLFAKLAEAGIRGLGIAIKEMFSHPLVLGAVITFFAGKALIGAAVSGLTRLFLQGSVVSALSTGIQSLLARGSSMMGGMTGRMSGRGAALTGGALLAGGLATSQMSDSSTGSVLGNTMSYAGTGAMMGSFLGPKGALIGGAAGGIYGLGVSAINALSGDNNQRDDTRIQDAVEAQTAASITDEQLARLDKLVGFAPKVRDLSQSVGGLENRFNRLDLDYREIDRTNRSLEKMAEQLQEINSQLSGGEEGFFDKLLGNNNSNSNNTGARNTPQDQIEELNKVMKDVLGVLMQSNDMNRKQLTATRGLTGNLYRS